MKRFPSVALSLFLATAAPALLAQAGSVYKVRPGLYRVQDARGLISAIGSERVIELVKGEYRLSEGYGISNPNAIWREVGGVTRLVLTGLKNFSVVGPEGRALVLGGSGEAPILEIERSTAVNFFNLRFAREAGPLPSVPAPGIKAVSVKMLQVDRCRFEASSGRAIEVEGCEAVRIGYSEIWGAARGALSALSCNDLEIYGSLIQGCGGSPLLYAESCGRLLVSKSRLEGNAGESLIELRLGEPASWGIGFDGCSFVGNRFSYFAGSPFLPSTASCSFAGNSFGPDWARSSVVSRGERLVYAGLDQVYAGFGRAEGGAPAFYFSYAAGIGFAYPALWELQEGADSLRALAADPEAEASIMLVALGPTPPRESEAWDVPGRVFMGAASTLEQSLRTTAKIELSIWADEPPAAEGERPVAEGRAPGSEYSGMVATADGKFEARVIFLVSKGSIYALLYMAKEGSRLGPEGDIGQALAYAELVQ
jgi:hypothetical protein